MTATAVDFGERHPAAVASYDFVFAYRTRTD
jgi:hypothetical protein